MSGADGQGVLPGQLNHGRVRAGPTHEAFAGRLAKGHAELDAGDGADQRLVEVLHGLDEMGLAEDEVDGLRLLDLDCGEFDFHSNQMVARRRHPVKLGTRLSSNRPQVSPGRP